MSASAYDVVIAGAGIVGCACAAEFASAGLRVAIVEPDEVGSGATAAAMGHIAVMDDSEAQFALCRYSQLLWRELAEDLPPACEYTASGAIWVAADSEQMSEVRRKWAFYRERDVLAHILDEVALADAEPNLRSGLAGGLLLEQDSVLYPPAAALFLVNTARAQGAELFLGCRVAGFTDGALTLSDGTALSTGFVVLANGMSVNELMPNLGVKPRKGHLVITDRYPGFLHHQLIELGYLKSAHALDADSFAFNAQPRRTGQILLGSSRQYGTVNAAIESEMLGAMLRRAIEYMPDLAHLSVIRGWTGFRASTPDNLPFIGLCPGYDKVFLAVGHEGLGITTSLGTAKILADIVLQRPSAIPIESYSPERVYALHS